MKAKYLFLVLFLGPLYTVQGQNIDEFVDSVLTTRTFILPNWDNYTRDSIWSIPMDTGIIQELNDSTWATQLDEHHYMTRCESKTTAWAWIFVIDENKRLSEVWCWHGAKWEGTMRIYYPIDPAQKPLEHLCLDNNLHCGCKDASQGLLSKLMATID